MAHPTRFERVTFAFGGQRFYATNRGITFSTNRKNPVLRAPATTDSCATPIPGTDLPFRRDRGCVSPQPSAYRLPAALVGLPRTKCSGQVEVRLDTRAKARARPRHYAIQELRKLKLDQRRLLVIFIDRTFGLRK